MKSQVKSVNAGLETIILGIYIVIALYFVFYFVHIVSIIIFYRVTLDPRESLKFRDTFEIYDLYL